MGNGYDQDEAPDAPDHSFVWLPDGTRQELPWPTINGETAIAFSAQSIHDGIITAVATELIENDGWRFHLFQYDLDAGELTPLAEDVEIGVEAWNAYGWVVGNTVDGLVLLAGSQPVPLPYPVLAENPDDRFGDRPIVRLVSDDGRTIAGQVHTETGETRAVVWRCA